MMTTTPFQTKLRCALFQELSASTKGSQVATALVLQIVNAIQQPDKDIAAQSMEILRAFNPETANLLSKILRQDHQEAWL